MYAMNNSHQQYIDLYEAHRDLIERHSCEALNAHRAEAARLLAAQGLPDRSTERYKYTDAAAAFEPDFGLNLQRIVPQVDPYKAFGCRVANLGAALLYVVNDVPFGLSPTSAPLPEGVVVESFAQAAVKQPDLLRRYYNQAACTDRDFAAGHDGVTLLNTLLAQDGVLIYLPEGTELKAPVQVVHVSAAATACMSVRRVLVVAEKGAHGAILLCDHAEQAHSCLTTQVVEVFAAEGAEVELYSMEESHAQNTRFATLYAELQAHSRLSYDGVTLTGGTTRNHMDIRLRGEGARTELFGAVVADGAQRVDNNILVEHLAPQCTSDMLFKCVLNGESQGAFAGKVYVAPGAQQTASQQTNANLCASPTARAYSQPMLEIYADDVKCNHGSTIGKLDETALFYLQQRGIPRREACLLLQHAFVNEVLRHVGIEPLYERLTHLVDLRFRGELGRCRTCGGCGAKR